MDLKSFLFVIFLIPTIERIFSTFKQKERKGKIKHVWLSILLISSYLFCVSLAIFDFFMLRKAISVFLTIFGFLIMSAGIILRNFSIKTLGNSWSIHIKDILDQQLIKTGPYSLIRHPYYVAVTLEIAGVALYFNSFLSLWYILLIHFPLLLARIMFEEKELDSKFHNQFKKYQQETGWLLPKRF